MFINRYDYNFLTQYCHKHNIELEKHYSDDVINRNTCIIGKCITEGCDYSFDKKNL